MPQRSMQQLLEIRLDALKLDVGKVREVVQDARKRTSSIRDIKRRLEYESADGGREALRQIRSLARRIDNVLKTHRGFAKNSTLVTGASQTRSATNCPNIWLG